MTHVDLVQLAGSRGRLSEHPTVDPVTAEVIRGAMETICFEMATYVSRTATTPILNQSNERNATILDAQGRLAALSVGIPQFMLSSTLPVRFCLDFLEGELRWRPVTNHHADCGILETCSTFQSFNGTRPPE